MNIKDKPVVNLEKGKIYFNKSINWPEGSPDEIIKYIEDIKNEYSDAFDVNIKSEWYGYEDCGYEITGYRMESDASYDKRIKKEKDLLDKWEAKYLAWMETKGKEKAAKEQAKLDEQLRQYNLLKEKLEKAGKLP